jgi:hypothetical protein
LKHEWLEGCKFFKRKLNQPGCGYDDVDEDGNWVWNDEDCDGYYIDESWQAVLAFNYI